MTEADIRALPASRETDAMVRLIIGVRYHADSSCEEVEVPYTADTPNGWAAMRECVAWLALRGYYVSMNQLTNKTWEAGGNKGYDMFDDPIAPVWVTADTLPLAVARLVLLVKLRESEQKEKANGGT